MNKKIISRILVIITILGIMMVGNQSKAYVGNGYTIDVPSTYIKTTVSSGEAWAKSTGDNLNIQVTDNTDGEVANYTTLNESIETLKSQLSSSITIDKSEVTTINGYDCLHLLYKYSGVSIEQYAVPTKDKIYILTLAGVSSDYLTSSEVKSIVGSFKITNYVKPGSGTGTSTGSNNTISNTTSNTISNTTTNTVNNTTDDDDKNTTTNKTDDDDDDEDEDENQTSKKKKSSDDDDEDNNWVIIAIIAGAAVLCVAIIGTVIAVVVSKSKNKNQY